MMRLFESIVVPYIAWGGAGLRGQQSGGHAEFAHAAGMVLDELGKKRRHRLAAAIRRAPLSGFLFPDPGRAHPSSRTVRRFRGPGSVPRPAGERPQSASREARSGRSAMASCRRSRNHSVLCFGGFHAAHHVAGLVGESRGNVRVEIRRHPVDHVGLGQRLLPVPRLGALVHFVDRGNERFDDFLRIHAA